jgi:hypothetical protein
MLHGTIRYTAPHQTPIPIGDRAGASAIAHWLGNDIQYSQVSIDRWITAFLEVSKGGRSEGYQGTGNAFSVFATGTTILLQSEYVEKHKVCMNLEQVSAALERYRSFLSRDYKSPDFQATPFEVEFLAEGNEACECYLENGGVLGVRSENPSEG